MAIPCLHFPAFGKRSASAAARVVCVTVTLLVPLLPCGAQVAFVPGPSLPESAVGNAGGAADYDGDGDIDIATARVARDGINFLLGDGTGSFVVQRVLPGGRGGHIFVSGDFDGDGNADLACSSPYPRSLDVYLGDGAGGFAPLLNFPTGSDHSDVVVADFDRDGYDDIAISSFAAQAVYFFRGVLGGVARVPDLAVAGANALTVADFDVDGFQDVAVLIGDSYIATFLGDGAWGWRRSSTLRVNTAYDVASGDFDRDGLPDVAFPHYYEQRAAYMSFGDGAGGFADLRAQIVGAEFGSRIVAIGPDPEGRTDLMIASLSSVMYSRPNGRENPFPPNSICCPMQGAMSVADLDGDGYSDVFTGRQVLLNRAHLSREGNVDAAQGPPADVLYVNGSPGVGRPRRLDLVPGDPFEIYMIPPPSASPFGPVSYALYAWRGEPRESECNQVGLPFGLGLCAMPTPLTAGTESPQPRLIWNNIPGTEALLGAPLRPSLRAPASVVARVGGPGVSGTFFLQGLIRDAASPNGVAAVTNGVLIVSP